MWIKTVILISVFLFIFAFNCSSSFQFHGTTVLSQARIPEYQKILNSMSLEEKIGQLFIISTYDPAVERTPFGLHPNVSKLIQDIKPGGILLFGRDFRNSDQVRKLILSMQGLSKIGLFIASDEEGESVRRTALLNDPKITLTPDAQVIGDLGDPNVAYEVGKIIGSEISNLGINMTLAPVADVNSNPDNLFLGSRAFGSSPDLVAKMVSSFCDGLKNAHVYSVIKHFPGHGDTIGDTHTQTVFSMHTLDELKGLEFLPFQAGIESGCAGVLTAHIVAPNADPSNYPVTFSPLFLQYLRQTMGFQGLIVTDSLEMKAISDNYTPAQAAILSIKAGADILLLPKDIPGVKQALIKAVQSGDLSEKQINESVARILRLKQNFNLLTPPITLPAMMDNTEHIAYIKKKFPDFF